MVTPAQIIAFGQQPSPLIQGLQGVAQGAQAVRQGVDRRNSRLAYEKLGQAFSDQVSDPAQVSSLIEEARQLDPKLTLEVEQMISQGSAVGAGQKEFESLISGFTPEEQEDARRIKAGLSPRAVGSAAQTLAGQGDKAVDTVADTQAKIEGAKAGAKEEAKLIAQYKLKPKVAKAVNMAIAEAKNTVERSSAEKSNATALKVYDTAMSGLSDALGGTETGPLVGSAPALTANQQIAEGAVAAMAPVLKQLFRGAGEGTFTDKDQELLLQMVPTRKDLPAARKAKLENIDAIVRAKLGAAPATTDVPAQSASGLSERASKYLRVK